MTYRLNAFLYNSIGLLTGIAISFAVTASPAWSQEETSAGASPSVQLETTTADSLVVASPAVIEEHGETSGHTEGAISHSTEGAMPAGAIDERHDLEANIGFPQLKPDTYVRQIFWLFVSFIILFTLMSKVALPKVGAVLDTRAAQKEGNLKSAEQMHDEATKVKTAFEASLAKAHESAAETLKAAENVIVDKTAAENTKFAEQARTRIVAAEQAITKAKQDALASLADISAEIAADMVNKITGAQLTKADAKKAVTAEMQKG